MCKILTDILNRLVYTETVSVKDLAKTARCSESLIYKVLEDEADLGFGRVQMISLWLTEKGVTDLATAMLTPEYEVCPIGKTSSDGRIDDEAADMLSALGQVVDAHKQKDEEKMSQFIEQAELVLSRMKAERDRIRN